MKKTLYLMLLLVPGLVKPVDIHSQNSNMLQTGQDTLLQMSRELWKMKDDSSRLQANSMFYDKFREILARPSAFGFPFDSLTSVSRLRSDNGNIRIITWNIPLNDGRFNYFGFIEMSDGRVFELTQKKNRETAWENKVLNLEDWYGAVYYKIISTRINRGYVYTLLGWDGNNESSNIKLIDILSFDSNGRPVFGKNIFKTPEGIKNRILIEYSKNATAVVRYDYQILKVSKGKQVKEKRMWMIVMDRLIPMMPSMTGIRKYYVPSGDTHDAFLFMDGSWTFVEDISAGNSLVK